MFEHLRIFINALLQRIGLGNQRQRRRRPGCRLLRCGGKRIGFTADKLHGRVCMAALAVRCQSRQRLTDGRHLPGRIGLGQPRRCGQPVNFVVQTACFINRYAAFFQTPRHQHGKADKS